MNQLLTSPTWPSTTCRSHTGSPWPLPGVWLTGEDERINTAHELVALAVPALVRLRTSALLADAAPEPVAGESELALESAGALRLLDRALVVHGRDHGYLTDAWCQHAHVASADATSLTAVADSAAP